MGNFGNISVSSASVQDFALLIGIQPTAPSFMLNIVWMTLQLAQLSTGCFADKDIENFVGELLKYRERGHLHSEVYP
jgi:hypothetical protein